MSGIWLFVRGNESIRLMRPEAHCALRVNGPGARHEQYDFDREEDRTEFQRSLEAQLMAEGWVLESFSERRGPVPERRQRPRQFAADRRHQ
jgi:hypothetical protein